MDLEQFQSDHQVINERVDQMSADPRADRHELAMLKKLRLRIKDHIEGIIRSSVFAA